MVKRIFIGAFLASLLLGLGACGDHYNKTVYYTVTSVNRVVFDQSDQLEGYRFWLRDQSNGHPAYVFYPDERFKPGDQLVMQRTKKEVTFSLKN